MASSFDAHNGKVTDKYTWSQTIGEIDVRIPVSEEIKKGKQISVEIDSQYLQVRIPGSPGGPLVGGRLTFPVKKADSYWNLVPGECVCVFLQKIQER